MKRSGFGEVMKLNALPVTPVPQIDGADQIVSGRVQGGSCDTIAYTSSVRDSAMIRQETKPKPLTPRSENAQHWIELHRLWAEQAEQERREREGRFIVTFDPITGVKTETPR